MKILIFGAKGLIGRGLFLQFLDLGFEVVGTLRDINDREFFNSQTQDKLKITGDISCNQEVIELIEEIKPEVIINCLGITKHVSEIFKPNQLIEINSQFPHFLSHLSSKFSFRLINFSTDCIFSGLKGDYQEDDLSDAKDLYGKSKYLGEISDNERVLTLRTSFVGHSAHSKLGLIDWFLSSTDQVRGFSKAIYTGLTTKEIGNFLVQYIFENTELNGLYNLSGPKISKFNLLTLVKEIYNLDIEILIDSKISIDRSLNSSKIKLATGYEPPSWESQILELNQVYSEENRI